jgi:long-subunit fatty acid transport protein
MNKDIDFMYTWDDPAYQSDENVEFVQEGALYTLSPAFAVQVIPELYFGATLNFWDNYVGRNGWTKTQNSHETGTMMGFLPFERRVERKEDASFKGTNAHFGLLWAINSSLTLGGVYKTPFNADVEKKKSFFQSTCYTTLPPPNCSALPADETTENVIMRMPASYGLGLAYRHSDAWTLAIDVYRTEWSNFVIRQEDESEVNPLTSESIDNGRLKDTTQIRLGTEYLFIKEAYAVPVRFGLFYDPEPATGHIDEFYGFSLGAGYARGRIVLDAAYQFRKGNNTSGDIPSVEGLGSDVDQHLLMVSGILYFGGK